MVAAWKPSGAKGAVEQHVGPVRAVNGCQFRSHRFRRNVCARKPLNSASRENSGLRMQL